MKRVPISTIMRFVKKKMGGEGTGHDWFHIERVLQTARSIAKKETEVDIYIVQAAALLHDIGDYKVNTSHKTEEEILDETFTQLHINVDDMHLLKQIILNLSFSKNIVGRKKLNREGKIVQDADRLEALGAIGIARAFAYGGKKNRLLYDPTRKPQEFTSVEAYRNSDGSTINHFYEKLFKIRKHLNTKTAKEIAKTREKFMKDFLKEFYAEWDGKA